jgi:hypothetical protein
MADTTFDAYLQAAQESPARTLTVEGKLEHVLHVVRTHGLEGVIAKSGTAL